jgi:hypothetical protein
MQKLSQPLTTETFFFLLQKVDTIQQTNEELHEISRHGPNFSTLGFTALMHSQAQETQPCATRLAFAANGVSPKYMYFYRCVGGLPRPDSALLECRNAATCLPHF